MEWDWKMHFFDKFSVIRLLKRFFSGSFSGVKEVEEGRGGFRLTSSPVPVNY